jgi:hypothetical protein
VVEFETADPALRGEMAIPITLVDANGGTEILGVHEGLPPGVPPADDETGWREALAKLAALLEQGWARQVPTPWTAQRGASANASKFS